MSLKCAESFRIKNNKRLDGICAYFEGTKPKILAYSGNEIDETFLIGSFCCCYRCYSFVVFKLQSSADVKTGQFNLGFVITSFL